jgi:hypothetical protein
MALRVADGLPEQRDGQRGEKRAVTAAAGLLAAVSGGSPGSAMAELVTVTTTQQYSGTASPQGTTASFDVLFTPVQNATDLVSISAGSVYTGESASLTIQAIASDDSPLTLFGPYSMNDFFQTVPLSTITNNAFTDFSAQDIKGLRFSIQNFAGFGPTGFPSITLPVGTEFQFVAVPEPAAAMLLGCGLAAVLIGRRFRKLRSAVSAR